MSPHPWTAFVQRHLPQLAVPPERAQDIVDELAAQLDAVHKDALASGATDEEASARARAQIPDWAALAADIERAERAAPARVAARLGQAADRRGGVVARLAQDIRMAARLVRRSPSFAGTVILTLALGMAATTAVFSVLDGVVLRPLPYRDPDRLVAFWDTNHAKGITRERVSPVNFMDYRALQHVFVDAAAWWVPEVSLTDPDLEPVQVNAVEASSNFFDVLGVQPALGAGFPPAPLFTRDRELVISHRLWRTRYGSASDIVGRTLVFNGAPHVVTGVMPAGFHYPAETDVWQRLNWDLTQHSRGAHFMGAIGRLAPAVTLGDAEREVAALARRLGDEFPATNQGWEMALGPLDREIVGSFRSVLLALFAAVGALLLIACLNVASLLLVRGVARSKELAIRLSLGATAGRIVQQLLVENLFLSGMSVLLGVVLATLAVRAIVQAAPIEIPRLDEVAVSARAFGFAALLAVGATLVFGLGPAVVATRVAPESLLRDENRGATQGRRARWLRQVLVAAEIAIAIVLLTGAGLLLRSIANLVNQDAGFRAESAVTVNLRLTTRAYRALPEVARFYGDLTAALQARNGVRTAGVGNFLPLTQGWRMPFGVVGRPPAARQEEAVAQYHSVSEGYLEALGVPLRAGRALTEHDTADRPGVALVNDAFVQRYFPDGDAVGHRLTSWARNIGPIGSSLLETLEYEIVGVVGDVKNTSLVEASEPAIYTAVRQFPFRSMHVVVSGGSRAADLVTVVREEVRRIDPAVALSDVRTLDSLVADASARPRLLTWLMSVFSLVALGLAAFGLYGLLAYSVGLRRQEISIRRTLGARAADVIRLVVRDALTVVAIGTSLGVLAAFAVGRSLSGFLFGVAPGDPTTSVVVGLTVALSSCVAALAPTRRAVRINPVTGLRGD